MKYIKPEVVDIDVDAAGGAACNYGWTNYSMGCTAGPANSTACSNGSFYTTGPSCSYGGYPQSGTCRWGWSGNP